MYEHKLALNKAKLIKNLVNMKYKNDTTLTEDMGRFKDCINKLLDMEIIFEDKVQELLLMSKWPNNWEMMVVALITIEKGDFEHGRNQHGEQGAKKKTRR